MSAVNGNRDILVIAEDPGHRTAIACALDEACLGDFNIFGCETWEVAEPRPYALIVGDLGFLEAQSLQRRFGSTLIIRLKLNGEKLDGEGTPLDGVTISDLDGLPETARELLRC